MSDGVELNKETLSLFTENCKDLNKVYYENCASMKDNCEWIKEKFGQLFQDEFQITPLDVIVEKRGLKVVVQTGNKTVPSFSTKIFEDMEIGVGIMVNFNNEIDFVFSLDD